MTDEAPKAPTPNTPVEGLAQMIIGAALNSSDVPKFYCNSFINAGTEVDMLSVFQTNGNIALILNMNYSTAKSYATALSALVSDFEKRNNLTIPTPKQMTAGPGQVPVTTPR